MTKSGKKGPLSLRERDRVRGSTFKAYARKLRKDSTDAERLLWTYLRNRQMEGFKFRRQVVIEPYIVDFVCLETMLVIEVDGGQHNECQSYDDRRTNSLMSMGYQVIRFWNHDVLVNTRDVLERIRQSLIDIPSPPPSP